MQNLEYLALGVLSLALDFQKETAKLEKDIDAITSEMKKKAILLDKLDAHLERQTKVERKAAEIKNEFMDTEKGLVWSALAVSVFAIAFFTGIVFSASGHAYVGGSLLSIGIIGLATSLPFLIKHCRQINRCEEEAEKLCE